MRRTALFALLIGLLAFGGLASAQTATPTLPYCATPNPATSTPVPTYENKVLGYNPIGYWPLNETAGTIAIDESGYGSHGTYSGPTLGATTFLNGEPAPSFDGVNDNIVVPTTYLASLWGNAQGTLSLWLKGTGGNAARFRASNWPNELAVSLTETNFNIARTGNSSGHNHTRSASSGGNWFHAVITWDATANQEYAYYNGVQYSSWTSTAWSIALNSINIGSYQPGASHWNGNISQVAVFNVVLAPEQIADLYNVPSSTPPTPTATPSCQVFNPTATPTADLWDYWTLPAPSGTPGQAVAVKYEFTAGDISTSIAGLIIVMWLIIFTAVNLIRRR